jgi:hypothetical protein
MIIARATAGDAIWFKATIDRIADILAWQGDNDPSTYAALKPSASSPNPPKPSNCSANTKTTTGTDPPNHQIPPRNLPARRPKSASTKPLIDHCRSARRRSTPTGPGRVLSSTSTSVRKPSAPALVWPGSKTSPVLLNRLHALLGDHCTINLKPVIDLPAGHTPVDSHEIPARLREQLQLRCPAPGYGDHPTAASTSSTPTAPNPSATPSLHKCSGAPRHVRR